MQRMRSQNIMSTEKIDLIVPDENAGARIDSFLAQSLEADLSRSFVQKLIRSENITVNGSAVKPNCRLRSGDTVSILIPEPKSLNVEPRNIPLDVIYEDSDLAVINKAPGITVHPGSGTDGDTLVSALMFHLEELSSIGGVERPGIVHRLDKDTAGLMVIAKNDRAHRAISAQFADRTTFKEYIAVVTGAPREDHFFINTPIGRHQVYRHKMTVKADGRDASTEVVSVQRFQTNRGNFSVLRLVIHTGRTHQIRVHLSSYGFPIVGDPLYSKNHESHGVPFLLLASVHLAFNHPSTNERVDFSIPPPVHIQQFIDKLQSEN